MVFFQLLHLSIDSSPKDIGYYSSLSAIEHAIEMLSQKPGFSESKDGFSIIKRFAPNLTQKSTFFEALIYFHSLDYSVEYSSSLGYFPNKRKAEQAICGFVELNHNGTVGIERELIINKCILNRVLWPEGFTRQSDSPLIAEIDKGAGSQC